MSSGSNGIYKGEHCEQGKLVSSAEIVLWSKYHCPIMGHRITLRSVKALINSLVMWQHFSAANTGID
jgi:hypothetical protein